MAKKAKRGQFKNEDLYLTAGIHVLQLRVDGQNRLLCCAFHSLVIFLTAFGAVGCFLSAFNIEYNVLLVAIVFAGVSFYFSWMYSTRKLYLRDVGYIVFFLTFYASIYYFRDYANSGFYTILNVVLQRAQNFFGLAGMREYSTKIDNGYLTVAVAAAFVGVVVIIVLNILLSYFMSIFWAVIMTLPILIVPMYMKLYPSPMYILCLAAGYAIILAFKANGHYWLFEGKSIVKQRLTRRFKLSYTVDNRVFGQIVVSMAAIAACVVVLSGLFVPSAGFDRYFKDDRLRDQTSETIGNFVLLGFSGLLNRYNATGGINGGRLGGVASVRPDYETDLVVTYTPYSSEGVYLRAYTGGRYGDNQWEEADIRSEGQAEAMLLSDENYQYYALGTMEIENVGANILYQYYPNYTDLVHSSMEGTENLKYHRKGLLLKQKAVYQYYPKLIWETQLGAVTSVQIHAEVDELYLEVPQKNQAVIAKECDKIGLTQEMTENQIVERVKNYFEEEIPYTLRPGATPKNSDFVNYFLTKNRKGYCAHFASAATLIFRQMGIPARYVEGYAFSYENVLASEENQSKRYQDYYTGYNELGETMVMDVEVTDAMAHAWVEYYVEGFGWKIADVTPGGSEDTGLEDFWSAFTGFLRPDGAGNAGNLGNGGVFGSWRPERYLWIVYVLGVLALMPVVFVFARCLIQEVQRYRRLHQKDLRERIIARYADICDRIRRHYPEFCALGSHAQQLAYIKNLTNVPFNPEEIAEKLEKLSFSNAPIDDREAAELLAWLERVRRVHLNRKKME